jgi:uncharacterized protein YfiM (DUF2279 family)
MRIRLLVLLLFFNYISYSQDFLENSPKLNIKRTLGTSVLNVGLWSGSIGGLYFVWYKGFPKSNFHSFDDSQEWQQMDKIGHLTTSYQLARTSGDLYNWSGVSAKKSTLIGSAFAFSCLLSFEFLDAYNTNWGFSWSDIGANTSGVLLYGIQNYFWGEQFVKPKFSYHTSGLSQYRPNVLGNGVLESLLKDYNGQTYWLSFNPISMLKSTTAFPKWINLSLGYSINNQLIGDGGTFVTTQNNNQLSFTPYRQFYLSLDIDWETIPVKSKTLKLLLRGLNFIKIPFPTIEFSNKGVKGYGLYF